MPTSVLVNERMQNLTGLVELTVENHAEADFSDHFGVKKILLQFSPGQTVFFLH